MKIDSIKWLFIIGMCILVVIRIIYGLSTFQFLGCVGILLAITLLLLAIELGCFKKIELTKMKFPAFRYIYFETQGTFSGSASLFSERLEGLEELIDPQDPNAKFIGMYFDHPSMLKNEKEMRVCWGFAFMSKEAEIKYKTAIDKLKDKGAAERQLPEILYVYGKLQFYLSISFIIAVKKIYPLL